MNKKMIKSFSMFLTAALVSAPVFAQEPIQATINSTVDYTLNGSSILDDSTTISYNNKNYVSISDLSKLFGFEVSFDDATQTVSLKSNQMTSKAIAIPTNLEQIDAATLTATTTLEVATPVQNHVTVAGATIIEINEDATQITILPAGVENTPMNQLVLNVSEETVVSENLQVGDTVNVKHSLRQTFSIPAQTSAFEIVKADFITLENASIIAISEDGAQITILLAGTENTPMNQLVLNVSEETVVSENLQVGDTVNVKHSLRQTFSLPAQTPAFEIIKADSVVAPEFVTIESATIKGVDLEFGEVAILVDGQEDVPSNHLILKVSDETTTVRHELNRMAYRLESLEEGLKVAVKHSPVMTASLPAQTAAFEIVILQDQAQ